MLRWFSPGAWVRAARWGNDDGYEATCTGRTGRVSGHHRVRAAGMAVERDLGVAFGLVVRSMGSTKSIGAGFKALRQGEVTQYTECSRTAAGTRSTG